MGDGCPRKKDFAKFGKFGHLASWIAAAGVNDGFAALGIACALVLMGIMGNWQFRV